MHSSWLVEKEMKTKAKENFTLLLLSWTHSLNVIKVVIMEHLLYRVLQILPLVQRLQQVIMSCRQNTSRWLEKVEDIQVL